MAYKRRVSRQLKVTQWVRDHHLYRAQSGYGKVWSLLLSIVECTERLACVACVREVRPV